MKGGHGGRDRLGCGNASDPKKFFKAFIRRLGWMGWATYSLPTYSGVDEDGPGSSGTVNDGMMRRVGR